MDVPGVNILGVSISAINLDQTLDVISSWKNGEKANYIICRDAHGLVHCQKDEELRNIHNCSASDGNGKNLSSSLRVNSSLHFYRQV